jgi:chromosome segregation ATPase
MLGTAFKHISEQSAKRDKDEETRLGTAYTYPPASVLAEQLREARAEIYRLQADTRYRSVTERERSMENEITVLKAERDMARDSAESADRRRVNAEQESESLKKNLEDLQTAKDTFQSWHETVVKDNKMLSENYDLVQRNMQLLGKQYTGLQNENDNLKSQLQDAKRQTEICKSESQGLKAEYAEVKSWYESTFEELKSFKSEVKHLQESHAIGQEKLAEAKRQVEVLKADNDSLKEFRRTETISGNAMKLILDEYMRADLKFPKRDFRPHELLAILWEEFEELKNEVFKNQDNYDLPAMEKEATQVGAVAMTFIVRLKHHLQEARKNGN